MSDGIASPIRPINKITIHNPDGSMQAFTDYPQAKETAWDTAIRQAAILKKFKD